MIVEEGPAESEAPAEGDTRQADRHGGPPRPKKQVVNGWIVLDKPVGMTSTHAVALVKLALKFLL